MAEEAENPSQETMIDERQELMISPLGGQSTLRTAHFLKPSSVENPPPYPLTSNLPISGNKEPPLKVKFSGRRYRVDLWASWVRQLLPKYQKIWKKAGIHEAILSSTYPITRRKKLVISLAEKWNCETNTFVLPWGESTLTLEDMRVLGGFSVLGYPVSSPEETRQMSETEQKLCLAQREVRKKGENHTFWMKHFMGSGHILEHEAFLSLWLARYVLPTGYEIDSGKIFPLAIRLSRGTRLALAPAVLASIYRDLSMLKKSTVSSLNLTESEVEEGARVRVQLWAPFQLVMIWVWERFPTLRPNPKPIQLGDPRAARWQGLEESFNVDNVRRLLDSAGDCFQWRPYAVVLNNWKLNKFYREANELVMVDRGMDSELASFVMCIRVSELVGLDCVEQYLPHRVSMQFGYDQDVPGDVQRFNGSFVEAWRNYCRPIRDGALYIPARLFESDVTARYFSWRVSSQVASKDVVKKRVPRACCALIDPGSPVDEEDGIPIAEFSRRKKTKTDDVGLTCDDDEPHSRSSSPSSSDVHMVRFRQMKDILIQTDLPQSISEELSTPEYVTELNYAPAETNKNVEVVCNSTTDMNKTDPPQSNLSTMEVATGLNCPSAATKKDDEVFSNIVENPIQADPPQSVSENVNGLNQSSAATKFFTVFKKLRADIDARSANLDESIADLKQEIWALKK